MAVAGPVAVVLLAACDDGARLALDGPAVTRSQILGGEVAAGGAATESAVVGIYTREDGEPALCTGTLLRPSLVLTARHCVADTVQSSRGGDSGACETTVFEAPFDAGGLGVSRATELYPEALAGVQSVAEVHVPDTDAVCGADLALLVLGAAGPSHGALDIVVPRWAPARVGELVMALGYGSDGEVYGVRRRSEPFAVECLGAGCTAEVRDGEFAANAVSLDGDSGGPALSENGELVGVLSRHAGELAVYEGIGPWRPWLEAHLADADESALGGSAGGTGQVRDPGADVQAGAAPGGSEWRGTASCSVVAPGSGRR